MTTILAFLRLELDLQRSRVVNVAFFGVLVPVFVTAVVLGQAPRVDAAGLTAGVLVLSSCLVVFRHLGHSAEVLRLERTVPLLDTTRLGRRHYVAARALESAVLAALPLGCAAGVAAWLHAPFPFGPVQAAAYALWVVVLCSGTACVLGALRAPASLQVLDATSLLVATVFPLFYPASSVPRLLAGPMSWLPPSPAMAGLGGSAGALIPLAAWAAVLAPLGAARLPWREERG
jgi:hypothetical protein